jgi:DNA-directed RNA polymerase subunit beta'
MAVHVPLSIEAQVEARALMMSTNNILSPANGKPIIVPTQDIVLGIYNMTREQPLLEGERRLFGSYEETRMAYDQGGIGLQACIRLRIRENGESRLVDTTVGRVLLYEIVPPELKFEEVNRLMNKRELANLIDLGEQGDGHFRRPPQGPWLRAGDPGWSVHRDQGHGDACQQAGAARGGAG